MAIYNPLTGPTAKNVLNANPIGYASEKIGNPLGVNILGSRAVFEPLATKLDYQPLVRDPSIDTRGMYYGDKFSPEISKYASDIGIVGNLRHATSAAQWKDKIAQALTPMKKFGGKPGWIANTVGGIGANILGLGHEFQGLTKDWSQIKDPNWWRASGEDVLANLYGSIKGKTSVSEQEMYDSMLNDFIYDQGIMSNVLDWGTISGSEEESLEHLPGMSLQKFRNLSEIRKNRRKKAMQQKIRQHEKIEKYSRANVPTPTPKYTGPITHDFDPKQDTGRRPDKPGGFTDPGKGSYGPHMAYGGRVSYFDGGLASLWLR